MAKFLTGWLNENKFETKQDDTGNVFAVRSGSGAPLLLCGHMDTVEPGVGIKPQVVDGMVKSDGKTILGADNKAALAAIMTAVETNKGRALEILFTVKEETGGGVEFFPFEWIKAKKAVVFDSCNPLGGIILRSPFIANFHITIAGKAAHASMPDTGVNAFVPAFAALPTIPLGVLDNRETSVNIGKMLGGTGANTVPDKIRITGEVRSYNETYFEARLENIKSIFKIAAADAGTEFVFVTDGYCPGYSFSEEDAMVKEIAAIYKEQGLHPVYHCYSGVSDANILNNRGIKTINLTDGSQFAHTTKEQIAVADLEALARIAASCIDKL